MLVTGGLHLAERTVSGRAYLLVDGLTCVLVDTGAPDGTLGVGELITSASRKLHEVRAVLLTHAHRGHAGNADGVRRLTGARLLATAAVAEALAQPGAPPRRRLLRTGSPWPEEPVRIDQVIEPGEHLDLAGGIDVIDAPGHAPGAVAFHLRGPDALCVGDAATLDRAGALVPPPPEHCVDPEAARATAHSLAALGARVLAPGHGYAAVDGRLPVKRRG